jgi:hypothetical protein
MTDFNTESLLEALGLQRRSSADRVAPVAGALILGGLIGAGLALLFAPKSGEELRRELGQRVDEAFESKDDDLISEYEPPTNERPKTGFGAAPGTIPSGRPTGF